MSRSRQVIREAIGPYRPSNGSEGEQFYMDWCDGCERDINEDCDILARSLAFDIGDPQYPKEWVRIKAIADDGLAINCGECTAFVERGKPVPPPRCEHTTDMFEGK